MYQQMLSPLNNVSSFAKNIVILVAIAGAIILTLIVVLQIRERKFEIGVLMSLGESKVKIVTQFFTELVMVMVVAVVLSSIGGSFVGTAVGKQLLNQQTEQTTSANTNQANSDKSGGGAPGQGGPQAGGQPGQGGPGGFMNRMSGVSSSEAKEINKLNVKATPQKIAQLALIALGITLVAILVASIGVLRMQPKAILSSN
jgi:putative ABC transport system permease protein